MNTREWIADRLAVIAIVLGLILACYVGVAETAWEWRNPKANWTTFWSEMPAPLRFERMAKYQ